MTYPIGNSGFNFNNFGGTSGFIQMTPEDQRRLNETYPGMNYGGDPSNPPPSTGEQVARTMPGNNDPNAGTPIVHTPTAPVNLPDPVKDTLPDPGLKMPTNWAQLYMNENQYRRDQARLADQDRARDVAMSRVYGGNQLPANYMQPQSGDAWQMLQGTLQEQQYQQQQEDRQRLIDEANKPTEEEGVNAPKLKKGYELDPDIRDPRAHGNYRKLFPDIDSELGRSTWETSLFHESLTRIQNEWNSGDLGAVLAEVDLAAKQLGFADTRMNRDRIAKVKRYLTKAFNRAKKA